MSDVFDKIEAFYAYPTSASIEKINAHINDMALAYYTANATSPTVVFVPHDIFVEIRKHLDSVDKWRVRTGNTIPSRTDVAMQYHFVTDFGDMKIEVGEEWSIE